jgi:hypothetical protein
LKEEAKKKKKKKKHHKKAAVSNAAIPKAAISQSFLEKNKKAKHAMSFETQLEEEIRRLSAAPAGEIEVRSRALGPTPGLGTCS